MASSSSGCGGGERTMPLARTIADSVGAAIVKMFAFDEDKTTVLDFACGSGLLSRTLAAHCTSITGTDINPAAVSRYNARSAQQGLDASEMRAVLVSELSSHDAEGRYGDKFDVVACNMAYHHIADVAAMTRELALRVLPGGALFVSDLLKEDVASLSSGSGRLLHVGGPIHLHAPGSTVEHPDGLSKSEVQTAFEAAGLEDVEVEVVHSVESGAGVWHVFLASGWMPDGTNSTETVPDPDSDPEE